MNCKTAIIHTAALAFLLLAINQPARGQTTATLTTLYSFSALDSNDDNTDGANPVAGLIQGSDGYFYGTAFNGGSGGAGTVFRITSAGVLVVLHPFTGFYNDADGGDPYAGLIQGSDGNFYGTTIYGGGSSAHGTVFKMTPSGALFTLHSFTGSTDGGDPYAGLIQGSDGNLYGTTAVGGADGDDPGHSGTVFTIAPAGSGYDILYSFTGSGTDGAYPLAGLVQGSDGDFYGTTGEGGSNSDSGTVFKITPAGVPATLHSFSGSGVDGGFPEAALVRGSDGNFYGTTYKGGSSDKGTVFKITPAGVFTLLHSFTGGGTDGANPEAALVQGRDGNFYGTTAGGGGSAHGTVFKMTPTGTLTTLHGFTGGGTDGAGPEGTLVQGRDGAFYGTTAVGGNNGAGTVFKLSYPPVITSAAAASATAGKAFSYQIKAANSPTSFAATGLPAGLTVNDSTGLISGTPKTVATSSVTLSATNADGTGTAKLTLTVKAAAPPAITSATAASGKVGAAFSYQITATNSPTGYATSSIPPGLSFSTSTGKFTGTPSKAGSYKPLLSATNSAGTGRVNLDLTVNPAAPVITSALTESAQVGVAFSYQVTATNSPTKYAISSMPAGLSFNTTTGKLSGTPTKAGSYRPLVSATNSGGTGSANVALTVKPAKPVITSELNPPARQGVAFSYQITATNNPTSYATSSIPPGLSFSTSTGRFTGMPSKAGTYKPLVSATNSGGTGSVNLNLVVKSPD